MPQIFEVVFLTAVISRIESEGGGWVGGVCMGGGGGWGAIGRLKQTFKHKWQCCAISR